MTHRLLDDRPAESCDRFAAQSDERLPRLGVRRGCDRALLLDADSPHSRYGNGLALALDLHQPGALDRTVMAVVDFDRTFRWSVQVSAVILNS